jgi:hypothetical protein
LVPDLKNAIIAVMKLFCLTPAETEIAQIVKVLKVLNGSINGLMKR